MPSALRCLVLCLAMTWLIGGSAYAGDEVLQKAKSTYTELVEKQKEQMDDAFKKAIADATKAGRLQDIETLNREREAFTQSGLTPGSVAMKPAVQRYVRSTKAAFGKVKTVYDREIKAETKAENLVNAKALQQELSELQAGLGDSAQDRELIEVLSATWAYDGRFGGNDGTTADVLDKVRQELKQGKLEVGLHTLGVLSGVAATKAVTMRVRAADATLNLRLAEGSSFEVGELTQSQAKAESFKIPGSSLEVLSAVWLPQGSGESTDGTADYIQRLKAGAVDLSPKVFPNIANRQVRALDVTFRIATQRITVRKTEGSLSSVTVK
jgi:hypothetical protein